MKFATCIGIKIPGYVSHSLNKDPNQDYTILSVTEIVDAPNTTVAYARLNKKIRHSIDHLKATGYYKLVEMYCDEV